MAVENVVLARRWFEEVWNQRRTDTIDELLTDESVSHTDSGPLRGKREFKERAHAVFLSAFPDLRMTVEGTVAEGLAFLDPAPHCVLLDLDLPGGGGEAILLEIRRNRSRTRVAVCSGRLPRPEGWWGGHPGSITLASRETPSSARIRSPSRAAPTPRSGDPDSCGWYDKSACDDQITEGGPGWPPS
jgi:hypothetical protein